jgi:hypothetical protein
MSSMHCHHSVKKGVINGHGHLLPGEEKVNQNEAIFNFLEHNSLILNEWAVSNDGLDYMKLEPN